MTRKFLLGLAALVALAPTMLATPVGAVVPRVLLIEEFGYHT